MAGQELGPLHVSIILKDALTPKLKQMNTQIAKMGKTMGKSMGEVSKGAKKGIAGMLSLQSFVQKVVHYITFSIGVQMVMGVKRGMESLIETFKDFERAIVNAATVSGFLGSEFEKVRKRIAAISRELGRETVFSALEVAKAFYTLASAGIDISKVTKRELLPILDYAAATQSDLNVAIQAVLVTLKQFRMDMSDTGHVVDVFTTAITSSFQTMEKMMEMMKYAGPIAGVLGVKFEEIVAAGTSLIDIGYEAGQAGQRLNMVFTKLLRPTEHAKEMLEGMGITMDMLDPEAHSLVEILYTLQGAGFGAAEAANMFRARTAAAATALIDNTDAIARMVTRYEMAEGITHRVAEAQEQTLWGALKKVSNEFVAMATTVGEELKPIIIFLANFIKSSFAPILNTLGGIFKFVVQHAELFKTIIKLLIPLLAIYLVKTKAILKWTGLLAIKTKLLALSKATLAVATKMASDASFAYTLILAGQTGVVASLTAALQALAVTMLANPATWLAIAIGAVVGVMILFRGETAKLSEEEKRLNEELTVAQEKINDIRDSGGSADAQIDKLWKTIRQYPNEFPDILEKIQNELNLTDAQMGRLIVSGRIMNITVADLNQILAEHLKSEGEVIDETKELIEAQVALKESFDLYEIALFKIINATEELKNAEEALATDDTIENRERLIKATESYNESQKDYIKYVGKVLQAIRTIPGNLEKYIDILERSYEANAKAIDRTDDLTRAKREEERATQDLTEALLTYGAGTDEAVDAEVRLMDAIESRMNIQAEIEKLNLEYEDGLSLITKALEGEFITLEDVEDATAELSKTEIEILGYASDMIKYREEYIDALAEQAKWEAKVKTMGIIREEHAKFLNERLLDLYETQNKLFDIEFKLYKLRVDEDEQLDDMFQSLAEQGLISQEMIDLYSEMKKAQGGVLSLNKEFADVMAELTPQQQALVESFMAGEATQQDLMDAGISGIDTILSMSKAQNTLSSTTDNLADLMGPLIRNLIDMGIVSSDTAKLFFNFIDNAYDMAASEKLLDKLTGKLGESFEGVLGIISQLAMSLITGEEGAEDMASIWDELTRMLGLGETGIDELNSILGTGYTSLSQFSDEELILAAALKTTATDLGIYEQGMSGATIAANLGLVATNNLGNAIGILKGKVTESLTPLTTYKDALDKSGGAASTAEGKLKSLGETVAILASTMNTNVTDMKIEGQDIIDYGTEQGVKDIWDNIQIYLDEHPLVIETELPEPKKPWWWGVLKGIKTVAGKIWDVIWPFAQGGLAGLQRGISKTRGPMMGMIGEKGPEAVVPLAGANRKYGAEILEQIIPKYFPDMMRFQAGGVVGGGTTTYNTRSDNFAINGPINITTDSPEDFMNQMKYKFRTVH